VKQRWPLLALAAQLNRNLADIQAAMRGCYNQGANVELDALTMQLLKR